MLGNNILVHCHRDSSGLATKLGFFFAFVVAATAIGLGWNYGLSQEFAYEQEARKAHADYSKHGCYEITESKSQATSAKKADSEPCTPSEKAQKENDNRRDYADLAAQRSSALWAKIMGIAALVGMGLSLVGVALVWTTFRETRKANDIANASQRAWVSIDFKPNFISSANADEVRVSGKIIVKNVGKAVAKGIRLYFFCLPVGTMQEENILQMSCDKRWFTPHFPNAVIPSGQEKEEVLGAFPVTWIPGTRSSFNVIAVVEAVYDGGFTRATFLLEPTKGSNATAFTLGTHVGIDDMCCRPYRHRKYE